MRWNFFTLCLLIFLNFILRANETKTLEECTVDGLQKLINSSNSGTTLIVNCPEIQFTKTVYINKNLQIQGKGTILNGLSKNRLFVVAKQTGWVIDARLQPTPQQGGEGIRFSLENFILKNSTSTQIPNGCKKTEICKSGSKEKTPQGGAIYIGLWGHFYGKNLQFQNNKASGDGGAIYAHGGDSGTIQIEDSEFQNNVAQGGGGAIAVQSVSELVIRNSKFIKNISHCTTEDCKMGERGSGAIRVWASGLVVEKSEFRENKGNLGGAIGSLQSWFQVSDCLFENNESGPGDIYEKKNGKVQKSTHKNSGSGTRGGGAIYADTGVRQKPYFIRNSKFIKNSGPFDGGALYLFMRNAPIEISDSTFEENFVKRDRGAAIAIYGRGILSNLIFKGNKIGNVPNPKENQILFAPNSERKNLQF